METQPQLFDVQAAMAQVQRNQNEAAFREMIAKEFYELKREIAELKALIVSQNDAQPEATPKKK